MMESDRLHDRRDSRSHSGSYGAIGSNEELRNLPRSLSLTNGPNPFGFWSQLKRALSLAWPITIIQITQYSFGFVASIFCGQAGTSALDTVALANSVINVMGISIAVGLSSACDTLFAQIYGSSNKKLLGTVVQRSLIIIMLGLLPCIAVHINAEPLMLMLGQDRAVAKMTGEYLFIFIPGMVSFFLYIVISKYLMAQNIIYPTMVFGLISNGINALLHYILMNVYGMTTDGSAYAQMSAYTLMCILNLGFLCLSGAYKDTWDGWTVACMYDWGTFFKLAIAGLLMLCIEWWAFEVGIFLTGILGTVQLAAQTVIFQYETIYIMFPLGVAVATSINVGQSLGSGEVEGAKLATKVGMFMAVIIGSTFAAIFALGNRLLPTVISSDPEVIDTAAPVFYVLAIYAIFDAISSVSGGVLRGCGKQQAGAIIVALGYMVALSIGIPTMFLTDLAIEGFWIGLAIALMMGTISYVTLICHINWDALSQQAQERAKTADAIDAQNERRIRANMPVEAADPEDSRGLLDSDNLSIVSSDRFSNVSERSYLPHDCKPILRRYSSNMSNPYLDPFPDPVVLDLDIPKCSCWTVCGRLFYVFFCFGALGAGIFCRLWFPAPMLPVTNTTITTEGTPVGDQTILTTLISNMTSSAFTSMATTAPSFT